MSTFRPEFKTVSELFARDVTYKIPSYQRPYSWDCIGKSEKNNQINVMWDDLKNAFENPSINSYFFGSMVISGNKPIKYEVIDGQQRLTSLLLLFAALQRFVRDNIGGIKDKALRTSSEAMITQIDDIMFNQRIHGALTMEKKLKLEKNSGVNYDKVLEDSINNKSISELKYKNEFAGDLEVLERYFENRDYFIYQISEYFLNGGKYNTSVFTRVNEFFAFLKVKVNVVTIKADNFNTAFNIFEVLNNRGLPLSSKDLFRNFILKEFDALKKQNKLKYSHIDPNQKWKDLEDDFDLRSDFINRWVECVNSTQQRYSAFNALKEIYNTKYSRDSKQEKIEVFYDEIKQDLSFFSEIINNEFDNKHLKAKINFILNSGNTSYSLNLLLALSRYYEGLEKDSKKTAKVIEFLTIYELYLLENLLLSRFSSGPIYRCISNLNKRKLSLAIKDITLDADKTKKLKGALNGDIKDNFTAKLLLCKYVWLDEHETHDDVVDQSLLFKKATLEHIIPQNPDAKSNWIKDFKEDYRKKNTYKLGNMTLLTIRINSGAKNLSFSDKKAYYNKTKLKLTSSLLGIKKINESHITARQKTVIDKIIKDLGI